MPNECAVRKTSLALVMNPRGQLNFAVLCFSLRYVRPMRKNGGRQREHEARGNVIRSSRGCFEPRFFTRKYVIPPHVHLPGFNLKRSIHRRTA